MNENEKRARKLFKVDRELPKVEMQLPFGDVEMIDLDSMREILRFICHMEGIGATEQELAQWARLHGIFGE